MTRKQADDLKIMIMEYAQIYLKYTKNEEGVHKFNQKGKEISDTINSYVDEDSDEPIAVENNVARRIRKRKNG